MQYVLNLTPSQELKIAKAITDYDYWNPPHSTQQFIQWAVEDYINDYQSFMDNKKGCIDNANSNH